jgi:hypothetical protein
MLCSDVQSEQSLLGDGPLRMRNVDRRIPVRELPGDRDARVPGKGACRTVGQGTVFLGDPDRHEQSSPQSS